MHRRGSFSNLSVLLLCLVGCGAEDADEVAGVATAEQALETDSVSFDIPAGIDPAHVGLFASSGDLRINDRAWVKPATPPPELIVPGSTPNGPAPSAPLYAIAAGALSQTNIGVDASGPAVLANGSVMLRSNALLTSLAWSGARSAVMQQPPIRFDPFAGPRLPYPSATTPYTVTWNVPTQTYADVSLAPDTPPTLIPFLPGRYNRMAVYRGSKLKLMSGTYVFHRLLIDSGALVEVDNRGGLVTIVVESELIARGLFTKLAPDANVQLVYKGENELAFEQKWPLTVFAPRAKVQLSSVCQYYAGALFAKAIEVHQQSTFLASPLQPHTFAGRNATPVLTYLADQDFPESRDRDVDNDIQGVTHDDQYWYFDNAKDPAGCTISAGPAYCWIDPISYLACVSSGKIYTSRRSDCPLEGKLWRTPKSASINDAPGDLIDNPWRAQWDHPGALDYADGHLFVPLENHHTSTTAGVNDRAAIGILRLTGAGGSGWATPVGSVRFPNLVGKSAERIYDDCDQGGSASWVAYNPKDGYFYSSKSENATCINKYRLTYRDGVGIEPVGSFLIRDWNTLSPLKLSTTIQGADFSPNGTLFLALDDGGGIVSMDVTTGALTRRTPVDYRPDQGEELEGITVWDLDDGSAPEVAGQIHLLMIQNEPSNDSLFFKHYRVNDRSRL